MIRLTACAVATLVLLCSPSVAADQLELLLEGHPRLELTAEQIESLREDSSAVREAVAAAERVLERSYTQTYQAYYVSVPSAEFPEQHEDGWPYWTGIAGELRRYMEITSRAYALTGERKYLVWCRELMLSVASWRQWTDPWVGKQPHLDTHHLVRGMCAGLDLLWHDLPEQDRATIVEAIAEKGASFIREHASDPRSYLHDPSIWPSGYAMLNSALGVAGLTLLGEHEEADQWLAEALEGARVFFDEHGGIDGGLAEGLAYGSAAVEELAYFAARAEGIVGADLLDHPYLGEAIFFPAYFMAPGGGWVANFGDSGGPEGSTPPLLGLARTLVERKQCPVSAWYLIRTGETGGGIEALAEEPLDLPLARHFRDIDQVAMRSGWGESGSLLAFRSGHADHRDHLDQNSFILAWDDEWLLSDPGHRVHNRAQPPERGMTPEMIEARHRYTYGTVGHNAILVDGSGQVAERGRIVEFFNSPAIDYAVGDASASYEGLERYRRHIFSVAPDYYAVFDEIGTGGPARAIEVLLHTTPDGVFNVGGRPLDVGESREGQWVTVRRSGEAVARFLHPPRLSFEHRQWPHCEDYGHFLAGRVGQVTDTTLAWVLAAGPAGEVEIEGRSLGSRLPAVQVRVGDAVDTVAVASGAGGEAGLMSFTGAAAMVRESVEGVLRYALVRGTGLTTGEAMLVEADTPVSVGAQHAAGRIRVQIACDEDASVRLHCWFEPAQVLLDGVEAPDAARFDPDTWTIVLALSAGSHELELRGG